MDVLVVHWSTERRPRLV